MKIIVIRSKATDSSVFKLVETLSKNGHSVTLLVWDRQNNLNTKDYTFKIRKFGLKAPYDSFSAIFYLPFWWIYEFSFLLKNYCDIVHACDLDTLWPAIMIKSFKKVKLFYTIYDLYAYVIPNGVFQEIRDLIKYLVKCVELNGIKFTDTLFLVDKLRYCEVKSAKIKNLEYIYNSPPDIYYDIYKSKNKLVLFYGGTISKERGLIHILEAIQDMDDVKLVIAGSGDEEIVRKITSNEKTEYLGWIPYKDILTKSLESDIIFRFNDPNNLRTETASPNKLFEAMMCVKPIIMNSEMKNSKIVKKEKCGIVVPYGDVNAIKKAIIKLKDPALRNKLGLNGRKAYEKEYSWSIMEKRLLNCYNEVLNAGK